MSSLLRYLWISIKAPKVLNCGHSLCKECLLSLIERINDNFISCPQCTKNTEKKQNIEDYITNYAVIDIVNSSFRIPKDDVDKGDDNKNPKEFQIISLGDTNVGKTSIFRRLLNEKFEGDYNPTISVELYIPYYITLFSV